MRLHRESLDLLLCCVLPPLIVMRKRGHGHDFWICIELTLLGWVPGAMFAVFILYADPSSSRSAEEERQTVLAKLKNEGLTGRR